METTGFFSGSTFITGPDAEEGREGRGERSSRGQAFEPHRGGDGVGNSGRSLPARAA